MLLDFITKISTPAGFIGFIQLLIIVLEIVYDFYAFVFTRQVHLMNRSFETNAKMLFFFLAYLNLVLALLLVLVSISLV